MFFYLHSFNSVVIDHSNGQIHWHAGATAGQQIDMHGKFGVFFRGHFIYQIQFIAMNQLTNLANYRWPLHKKKVESLELLRALTVVHDRGPVCGITSSGIPL